MFCDLCACPPLHFPLLHLPPLYLAHRHLTCPGLHRTPLHLPPLYLTAHTPPCTSHPIHLTPLHLPPLHLPHPSTARGPPPLPNPPCTCMCRDSWASARPYSRQQLGCSAGAAVETGENSDPCSICFEQVGTNGEADTLTCGHIFCRDCIGRWRTGNGRARDRGRSGGPRADCPNCRAWGGVLVDLS